MGSDVLTVWLRFVFDKSMAERLRRWTLCCATRIGAEVVGSIPSQGNIFNYFSRQQEFSLNAYLC